MKRLLVLDLDETLFHALDTCEVATAVAMGIMENEHDYDFELLDAYKAIERPFVHRFLHWAFENFTVGIWTSATQDYADLVVEKLIKDARHGVPLFVFARDRCTKQFNRCAMYQHGSYDYEYIKDLKKIKKFGFRLEDIIVVDDTPAKLQRNYGNLVTIKPFLGDYKDTEMLKLVEYLTILNRAPNIRKVEKRGWANNFSVT
jgi:RNA polymerase II subunit A small phosphatase-like protein